MPIAWTDAQRSRFLLAVCESYIVQANGQRRYPSWDRVKTFLGPEHAAVTSLRHHYQSIRQRLINSGENDSGSSSATPGKRPYGDAPRAGQLSGGGDGGEIEDDCEEGMKSEDPPPLKIKLEAPQDHLIDADDDDDDLYLAPARMAPPNPRGQEIWERSAPWPGYAARPSPPSPPPPPPSPPRRHGAKRVKTERSLQSEARLPSPLPPLALSGPRRPVAPPPPTSHVPLQPASQQSEDFVIWS